MQCSKCDCQDFQPQVGKKGSCANCFHAAHGDTTTMNQDKSDASSPKLLRRREKDSKTTQEQVSIQLQDNTPSGEVKTTVVGEGGPLTLQASSLPVEQDRTCFEIHLSDDECNKSKDVPEGVQSDIDHLIQDGKLQSCSYTYQEFDDDDFKQDDDHAYQEFDAEDFKQNQANSSSLEEFKSNITPFLHSLNEKFQKLWNKPLKSFLDKKEQAAALAQLQKKFVEAAREVVLELIQQRRQPPAQWKHRPLDKGVMGGQKFQAGDIFFKFLVDGKNMFGQDGQPDHLNAHKSALNEVRAASALVQQGLSNLHVPMSAVFRTRGFCVVAYVEIPIQGHDTLIYGTDEAGKDVYQLKTGEGQPDCRHAVRKVAQRFKLKPHRVVYRNQQVAGTIDLAVDVEVHRGLDARMYILDFGRMFPPLLHQSPYCWFVQFRPEYLQTYCSVVLSADGNTRWSHPEDREEDTRATAQALHDLLQVIIPRALQQLLTTHKPSIEFELAPFFHEFGINMQFLGWVWTLLEHKFPEHEWTQYVLVEMIVRTIKTQYRQQCVTLNEEAGVKEDQVYLQLAVDTLAHLESASTEVLKSRLLQKYRPPTLPPAHAGFIEFSLSLLQEAQSFLIKHKKKITSRLLKDWGLRLQPGVELDEAGQVHVSQLAVDVEVTVTAVASFYKLDEAEHKYENDLRTQQTILAPQDPRILDTYMSLVKLYTMWSAEQPDPAFLKKAITYIQEMLDLVGQPLVPPVKYYNCLRLAGDFFRERGLFEEAHNHYQEQVKLAKRTWGDQSSCTGTAMNQLAMVFNSQGEFEKAENLYQEVLAIHVRNLGENDPSVLTTRGNLAEVLRAQGKYSAAEEINRKNLEDMISVLGDSHPHVLGTRINLAKVLGAKGKYGEAKELNRSNLEDLIRVLGENHPYVLKAQGQYDEAEKLYREVLECNIQTLGSQHLTVLTTRGNLAQVLEAQGKYSEAEEINRKNLEDMISVLGDSHPHVLTTRTNLAAVLGSQGKYGEAEEILRKNLEDQIRALDSQHPDILTTRNNLAGVLIYQRKYGEAEQIYQQNLEDLIRALGKNHPHVLSTRNSLALVLGAQGKYGEAEEIHRKNLEDQIRALGKDHPLVATTYNNLSNVLQAQGKYEEAEKMSREDLRISIKVLGPNHPDVTYFHVMFACLKSDEHHQVSTSRSTLASVLQDQGKYDEAEKLYREVLECEIQTLGSQHPHVGTTLWNLGALKDSMGDKTAARQYLEQAYSIFETRLGTSHPDTIEVKEWLDDL